MSKSAPLARWRFVSTDYKIILRRACLPGGRFIQPRTVCICGFHRSCQTVFVFFSTKSTDVAVARSKARFCAFFAAAQHSEFPIESAGFSGPADFLRLGVNKFLPDPWQIGREPAPASTRAPTLGFTPPPVSLYRCAGTPPEWRPARPVRHIRKRHIRAGCRLDIADGAQQLFGQQRYVAWAPCQGAGIVVELCAYVD